MIWANLDNLDSRTSKKGSKNNIARINSRPGLDNRFDVERKRQVFKAWMLRNRRASKTPCVEASRRRGFQSRQASTWGGFEAEKRRSRSYEASRSRAVEALKPRSCEAMQPRSVKASKPRSREATKRRGVEAWRRGGVQAAKPRSRESVEAWRRGGVKASRRRGVEASRRRGVEASRRGGVEGPFPEPMSPYPLPWY